MSYLAKRSSHPLSCNGDSSSEDDVFVNSKLDVYADYYDKPHPHSYFVDLYNPECTIADNYSRENRQSLSPLFSPRSPGTPRGENDAIIFTIKFCGKQFGEVGLFEPDISVLDWEGFRMYLFTSLNLENPESFVIYYSDDETDKIPIESEAEYKEALKIAKDKSTRQEKFVLDINRYTIGFPSLRSLVTSSIRRVNSVGSSVKAIPGPIPEKKDVTTSTSFSSLLGSLESLSIKTDRSELSEESDGLEMTTISNSQSITPLNFIIDFDKNDCVIKRIMPTKEKSWSHLGIKTYKVGYYEYNSKTTVSGARPLQHIGHQATVGRLLTNGVDRSISNNSGRKDEVSFYCTFYCHLDQLEKPILPKVAVTESPIEVKVENEQLAVVEDQNSAPSWFKNSMQQLKEEMSQEISSKINERFEDLVGNFNVKDVEERLRGVIKGYGSDVQERVICCCKGKECRRMPSVDEEFASSSRVSIDSEGFTSQNLWNIDLLKEELDKREKEIISHIESSNKKIKDKISNTDLHRPLSYFQPNEDLYIKERERVFNRIEDFRQRQSKSQTSAILRMPVISKADSICKQEPKAEMYSNIVMPFLPYENYRSNSTKNDLADFKTKTLSNNSDMKDVPTMARSSDFSNYYLENLPPHDAGRHVSAEKESPTATSSVPLEYDAKFMSDEDFPDGSVVPPGVVFSKSWLVMNTGAKTWDEQTLLFCSNYDSNPLVPCQRSIICPQLRPGEVAKIKVDLETPKVCGNSFVTKWKFEHNGAIFGNMLWCKIQVQLQSESICGKESLVENRSNSSSPTDQETVIKESSLNIEPFDNDAMHSASNATECELRALLNRMRIPKVECSSDILTELFNSNVIVYLGKETELLELILAEQTKGEGKRDIYQILADVLRVVYSKNQKENLCKIEDLKLDEDNDENYEDIEGSEQEKEDYEEDCSDDSSGEEYSEDDELSDEDEEELDEDDKECDEVECISTPCNYDKDESTPFKYEKDSVRLDKKSLEALESLLATVHIENRTDSIEFKYSPLSEEKETALTEDLDISNVPKRIEANEFLEEAKKKTCSMEVSDAYKGTEGNKITSEMECTEKESDEIEDYYEDSEGSSGEEYSSDDDELSDEYEEDLEELYEDEYNLDNGTPCEDAAAGKEEQRGTVILETCTDSLECKNRRLSKEKYLTENIDFSDAPESIGTDECFEVVKDEKCSVEFPALNEVMTLSEIECTAKESEIEESIRSDDDSSESCKVDESSSANDTQLQLLKATLKAVVAPEESLAAELAAAAVEEVSEKALDIKESSQSSEESMKKEKSSLQEHFKQNVEVNLDFEVIPHSINSEKSASPETRELPSGQGCPLTFREKHFTISRLPPPNPTTVPDSDDDDSYGGLVFIRPEDVPSSAPETAPGTPSASEDPRLNQEFPQPSESERSVSCSSLSDYKNADDEDSDSDSESCSSFSGVEEEDVAEVAATRDDGFDDISRMTNVVESLESDSEFCCYQWKE